MDHVYGYTQPITYRKRHIDEPYGKRVRYIQRGPSSINRNIRVTVTDCHTGTCTYRPMYNTFRESRNPGIGRKDKAVGMDTIQNERLVFEREEERAHCTEITGDCIIKQTANSFPDSQKHPRN